MTTISVADVDVKYRSVEVPDSCPMCGNRLATDVRLPASVPPSPGFSGLADGPGDD